MKILDFLAKYRIALCIPLVATIIALIALVVARHWGDAGRSLDGTEICLICTSTLAAFLLGFIWHVGE